MSQASPASLTAVRVGLGTPEYQRVLAWPFGEQVFYETQVTRLLQTDIPHRMLFSFCLMWLYRDADGNEVGFSTIDVSNEYSRYVDGRQHVYIPLLAVHPAFNGRGYGRAIVSHLIDEAALMVNTTPCDFADQVFLDVYTANERAIGLYTKLGFVVLNSNNPILDSQESNQPYVIMARNVRIGGVMSGDPKKAGGAPNPPPP